MFIYRSKEVSLWHSVQIVEHSFLMAADSAAIAVRSWAEQLLHLR